MNLMKSDKMLYRGIHLFKNKGINGMTSISRRYFQPGDWALLYDSRFKNFNGNFSTRWLGPYEVHTVYDNGLVRIKTINEDHISFVVNGHRLKVYHKPLSKEDFIKQVLQNY
jgi:hypothetical protein